MNIDHHKGNGRFGDFNWVDEEASSTGEMIYRLLFEGMGLPLNQEAAISLYTAILTDTGCFRFSNTTPQALRIAGSLLEMGLAPEKIASQLYEQRGLGQLHVLGELLSGLQVTQNGKIAWGLITQEMLDRAKISLLETEGFVNYPRSVKGVEVAVIFKEAGSRRYRVSLRSKGGVDVGRVASAFSGGGHHNAAGCTVSGDLDEVRDRVLDEIERWMRA
jgi:phosphoesterase RecJ-like protein